MVPVEPQFLVKLKENNILGISDILGGLHTFL